MDRETILRLSKEFNFNNTLSSNDISNLITQYCIENNKSEYDTNIFIQYILKDFNIAMYCVGYALQYYEAKFNICKVWSAPNPYQIRDKERKLLKIF